MIRSMVKVKVKSPWKSEFVCTQVSTWQKDDAVSETVKYVKYTSICVAHRRNYL